MISLEGIKVQFGKKIVLNDINLKIAPGERVAIMGRNGAGKTTLVETIMGLNQIRTGKIIIDQPYKTSMKAIFQNIDYDDELSLKKIYFFYSKIAGLKTIDYSVFEKYEIAHLIKSKFRKLSGGEKQKFKLMMCMEMNPQLILLDEITTSLDYEWRKSIKKIIKQYINLNPKAILILVSHDPKEIKDLCDTYYLIENKKITKIDNINLFFKDEDE